MGRAGNRGEREQDDDSKPAVLVICFLGIDKWDKKICVPIRRKCNFSLYICRIDSHTN